MCRTERCRTKDHSIVITQERLAFRASHPVNICLRCSASRSRYSVTRRPSLLSTIFVWLDSLVCLRTPRALYAAAEIFTMVVTHRCWLFGGNYSGRDFKFNRTEQNSLTLYFDREVSVQIYKYIHMHNHMRLHIDI